jgi:Flp pilus assembly protein TadG
MTERPARFLPTRFLPTRFLACTRGTTAVEFGLILPALAALVVGGLYTSLLVYSAAGLHSAVEDAARCFSVNSNVCRGASATVTYAKGKYFGIDTPTFTASTPACGHKVSGSVTIAFSAVVTDLSVPLTATSCFP